MKGDLEKQARALDFSHFTDEEILEHFNGRCVICGSTWGVGLHHIIFKSQLGHNNPRLPLCSEHHTGQRGIHGNPAFREKYEPKLLKIAQTFYQLKTQGALF